MRPRPTFLLSLPERLLRSLSAVVGGATHETAELVLPRLVRRSRLYEATAKNLLRILTELAGGVAPRYEVGDEVEPDPGKLLIRKTAGNAVELGSILAFGFSPLWLLAGAADVTHGSRTYLDALTRELVVAGVLRPGADVSTVDDLLAALQSTSGTAARLIDIPPLELEGLKLTLADLRENASSLPGGDELARTYAALVDAARRERRPLLEVTQGIGLAFFNSARHVGRQHVLDAYTEDLRPVVTEGFGGYARRVSRPYADAVTRHFDREQATLTERGVARLRRAK